MRTLNVNLYSGPGTGKSTCAALLFGKLKLYGITAELVTEYAKDLVWEERHHTLGFQPYVSGKQLWRMTRLQGKVDVVITDSPFILGILYQKGRNPVFEEYLLSEFAKYRNLNILLDRNLAVHPYNPRGRNQTEAEAIVLDEEIRALLRDFAIPHEIFPIQEGEETANSLVNRVLFELDTSVS